MRPATLLTAVSLFLPALASANSLTITKVDSAPAVGDPAVILRQTQQDGGGNTRFRFYPADAPERTGLPSRFDDNAGAHRYSLRDRDLGQSFTMPGGLTGQHSLQAITLRVGPTAQANEGGAGGAAVSMQIFEINGTAVLNNNGTTGSQRARWDTFAPDQAFTDDFISGLTFTSLGVCSGGVLPAGITTGNYMRWELAEPIPLEPGKQYAFMVMFDAPADDRGLALANWNRATSGNLGPNDGAYSFRRCGASSDFDDVFAFDLNDAGDVEAARASASLPADMTTRSQITPSTLGYPDVDTYRDFVYFIHTTTDQATDPGDPATTSGVTSDPIQPDGPYERSAPTDNGTTSIRFRPSGEDTDLGAVFRAGATTRQLQSITIRVGAANFGSNVPGLPVVFDFMRAAGDFSNPTFEPLWRVEVNLPASLVPDDYITFHLADQNQVLERDAAYAFLIGSNIQESPDDPDSDRFRLFTTNSNPTPDTYEIRREFDFGDTRPDLAIPPNLLNLNREMHFFVIGRDIGSRITGTTSAPSAFSLSVESLNGGIYQLFRSPDLRPPWTPLGALPGTGEFLNFTDAPLPAGPNHFYRIVVGP
ncbi:hypothetical protein BH23VER1_BH23VER1_03350 [soil metagenome]